MKKIVKGIKIGILIFVAFLMIGNWNVMDAQAASSAKYSYQKVDKSRTYRGEATIKAKVYYQKTVLKGKSKAIKKINKDINRECSKFLNAKNIKRLYNYAKESSKAPIYGDDTYSCISDCKVTYNAKGVISIRVSTFWYAGGITEIHEYGLTYSLRTGKRLYLTDVCSGSPQQIKTTVINKIKKKHGEYGIDNIKKRKAKKIKFYLKPGKRAVICYDPGTTTQKVTIESKYK